MNQDNQRKQKSSDRPAFHRALMRRLLWTGVLLAGVVVGFALWGSRSLPGPVEFRHELSPGLGLAALHDGGLDGTGVGIGIVDTWLYREHEAFRNRIVHYEELADLSFKENHGTAVASVAVGNGIGAAPGANLHYFAVQTADGPAAFASGLQRIAAYNREHGWPISIVSVSTGFPPEEEGAELFYGAIAELQAEGVLVLTSTMPTLTIPPWALREAKTSEPGDFDDVDDLTLINALADYLHSSGQTAQELIDDRQVRDAENGYVTAYLPVSHRYTASIQGQDQYQWEDEGGLSLATPYLAGLAALVLQKQPGASPDQVMEILTEIIIVNQHGLHVPNPEQLRSFLATLESQ